MNSQEYVKNVLVTEARDFSPVIARMGEIKNVRLIHACAGIPSELAEVIEVNRRFESTGSIDRVNLMEEISDILWYLGIASDAIGQVDFVSGRSPFAAIVVPSDFDLSDHITIFVNEIATEAGELVDKVVKKSIFYGKVVEDDSIAQHLRTIHQWCVSLLEDTGYTVEHAREINIAKLKKRYGEKFTEAAALDRNLDAERKILEGK
jgi:NTP pyrophosphatase (non-canonical NTP hydrolase)